jgi:hypothetical protein
MPRAGLAVQRAHDSSARRESCKCLGGRHFRESSLLESIECFGVAPVGKREAAKLEREPGAFDWIVDCPEIPSGVLHIVLGTFEIADRTVGRSKEPVCSRSPERVVETVVVASDVS